MEQTQKHTHYKNPKDMKSKITSHEAIQLGRKISEKHKNAFIFLTGDNGCGKSTLLLNIANDVLSKKQSVDEANSLDASLQPPKIIAYSMAPFSKFDSPEARYRLSRGAFERIGGSSGAGRHALLFQAIFEFCRSDTSKQSLFKEIASITRFSAEFKVRLGIDRSKLKRLHSSALNDAYDSVTTRTLLSFNGTLELYMRPGLVRIVDRETLQTETSPHATFQGGMSFEPHDLVDSLMFLRKIGALRVLRVSHLEKDEWISTDRLSSGQLSLYVGLMILASAIEDECIVLIDEPEISLHPAWQEVYSELIYKIAKDRKGCLFYIATHSPVVVSSAKGKGTEIINMGTQLIGETDVTDSSVDNIEEVFAVYFNTLTSNSHLVRETAIRAAQALANGNAAEFSSYTNVLRRLKPRVKNGDTKRLISEILKRTVS